MNPQAMMRTRPDATKNAKERIRALPAGLGKSRFEISPIAFCKFASREGGWSARRSNGSIKCIIGRPGVISQLIVLLTRSFRRPRAALKAAYIGGGGESR